MRVSDTKVKENGNAVKQVRKLSVGLRQLPTKNEKVKKVRLCEVKSDLNTVQGERQ